MADLPWYKYFPTLFDADTALCSNETVGGWQRLLNYMHPKGIDTIQGGWKYFARILRCQIDEAKEIIYELKGQDICEINIKTINPNHTIVTLTSRRLSRENNKKNNNRIRKQRQRAKEAGHADVTGEKLEVRSKKLDFREKIKEKEEPTPPSFSPLQENFLKIVKLYPKEFKLRLIEDAQWLKDQVLRNPKFKSLDLGYELDGWETWLEAEHRKKASKQANKFPKSDFKRSLTNRLNNTLKFQQEQPYETSRQGKPKPVKDGTHPYVPQEQPSPLKSKSQEAEKLWKAALRKIEKKINREFFDTWFVPTVGYDLPPPGDKLIIAVPDELHRNWLNENYSDTITEALKEREKKREWELAIKRPYG